jgi:hypothetical protein
MKDYLSTRYTNKDPVTKWKLDEIRNVLRYEKNGNWAEIDASLDPNGNPTKLYINGKLTEFIDYGWMERERSMDYCEWQIDHPNGLALGWWGTIWRLCVIFLALTFIFFAFIL